MPFKRLLKIHFYYYTILVYKLQLLFYYLQKPAKNACCNKIRDTLWVPLILVGMTVSRLLASSQPIFLKTLHQTEPHPDINFSKKYFLHFKHTALRALNSCNIVAPLAITSHCSVLRRFAPFASSAPGGARSLTIRILPQ